MRVNSKEKKSAYDRARYQANKESIKARQNLYNAANKENKSVYSKQFYKINREKILASSKKYRKDNLGKVNAYNAKRRAAKLQATPAWCETEAINRLYMWAKEFKLHVDHIVPLQNSKVCGLHCLKNLQLLTPENNRNKGNSWP